MTRRFETDVESIYLDRDERMGWFLGIVDEDGNEHEYSVGPAEAKLLISDFGDVDHEQDSLASFE